MSRPRTFVTLSQVSLLAVLLAAPGRAAAQTPITTCGQEVTGAATLDADLDCTGFDGFAVTIHGGTLTMNGHTITGGFIGVQCDHKCKLVGPGTVTASTFVGVNAFGTSIRMTQVDVTNCTYFGVQVWQNAVIDGPATISGNGGGIRSSVIAKLTNVTITGNAYAALEVANNQNKGSASVKGSTITGNGSGILTQRQIMVVDSTITGNGTNGISAGGLSNGGTKARAGIKRSTITGNNTDPECGSTKVCSDVATSLVPPKLSSGSTCDHSYVNGSGNPGSDWNVCALD